MPTGTVDQSLVPRTLSPYQKNHGSPTTDPECSAQSQRHVGTPKLILLDLSCMVTLLAAVMFGFRTDPEE
jgi:LDH2 family malate/lactate/ureidoglycolate dehydrogenase